MTHGIGTVEVKRRQGVMKVYGLGKTPRGQKYIRTVVPLTSSRMSDPQFKAQLAVAVKEILPTIAITP